MQRKPALAIAGAITSTVIAGALAVAANLGVIGSRSIDPVGNESPIDAGAIQRTKPKVVTVIVDVTPKPKVETVVVNDTSGATSTGGSTSQDSIAGSELEGPSDRGDDGAEIDDDRGDDGPEPGDDDGAEDDPSGSDDEGIDDDD